MCLSIQQEQEQKICISFIKKKRGGGGVVRQKGNEKV